MLNFCGEYFITVAFTPLTNTQKSFQHHSRGRGVAAHGKYVLKTPSLSLPPALTPQPVSITLQQHRAGSLSRGSGPAPSVNSL